MPGKQKLKINRGTPKMRAIFGGKGANKRMLSGLKTFKPRNEVPFATPKRTNLRSEERKVKNEKLWIGLIVVYLRYNQILFKSRQIANELNECDFV